MRFFKSRDKNAEAAVGAARGSKKASEILQIILLSLFMTSGFFALFSLVLLAILPGKKESIRTQANDLTELIKQLDDKGELRKTRDQVNEFKKAGTEVNLRSIVDSNLDPLVWTTFPEMQPRPLKGKTIEFSQNIKLKEADLQSLLNFIGRVKHAQSSIRVGSMNFSRNRRASTKDAWDATLTFYYYRNEEVLKQLGTKPAEKTSDSH
ncbi:MAG: hypothetical protein HY717_18690 [Planctomycetes bacterium]|nr:hypothetical protein [Planctomycetota bacterium]